MKLNKTYSTIFLILAAVFFIIFLISKSVFTLILAIIFLLIALYILSQLKKAGAAQSGPEPTRQAPAAEEDVSPAEIPSAEIQISSEAVLKRDLADMPEIVYSTVTKETTDDDIFPFVVIDAETTGLDPQEDEITEITAIKFDKGYVPVLSFSALLESRGRGW